MRINFNISCLYSRFHVVWVILQIVDRSPFYLCSMIDENQWENGFISAMSDKFWFVMIIKHGVSAVLPKTTRNAQFGDFCKVKVRENAVFNPGFRAQYSVTDFEKIEPLDPYRIDEQSRHVLITTIADVYGVTEHNGKSIAMLENDKFGTFIDLDGKIDLNAKRVKFEFKSKCSPKNQYLTIFVPFRVIQYIDVPEPRLTRQRSVRRGRSKSVGGPRMTKGFVGYENDDFYWVWCKDFTHDVRLHKDFCPKENILGKWVEMNVVPEQRNRSRVCQKVSIIQDVIKCRMMRGVPELFLEMYYSDELDGGFPAFQNSIVGTIVDVDNVSLGVTIGEKYCGWIARHKWEETQSRWKLSPKQDKIGSKINATPGFSIPRSRDSSDDETESFRSERYSDEDDDMYNERRESEIRRIERDRENRRMLIDFNELKMKENTVEDESTSGSTTIGNSTSTPRSNAASLRDNLRLKTIVADFVKSRQVRTAMKSENSDAYEELMILLKSL